MTAAPPIGAEVARTAQRPHAPSLARISLARARIEVLQFFRAKDSVVFTFALPIVFLMLFSTLFPGDNGISSARYFTAGFIASGIMASSFQTLAIDIALERDDGSLKRLHGTPMPPAAYLLGKVGMVFVVGLAQLAILLTVATRFYDVPVPDASGWLTLAWVFVLGISACSLLGIAYSAVASSGRSASAVVTLPFLILQFISGVFFPFGELPARLQEVAALFPLKWMCQGLRPVFLPDSFAASEPAGGWELSRVALALAVWMVLGLAVALRTFRWTRREDG
jgi:ABC-2 type transport system permease protein